MSSKNEVKIYKIREELSQALNNWQDIETKAKKTPQKPTEPTTSPRKRKLLKVIQQQLESL